MKNSTTRFFKINTAAHEKQYELEMLIREFIRPDEFEIVEAADADVVLPDMHMERNSAKRYIYDAMAALTGYKPEWGTLTGVRPTKLAGELMSMHGYSREDVKKIFLEEYYVNEEKTELVLETCENQRAFTVIPAGKSIGIYIGIPFCPTRCLYCSFTSNQADDAEKDRYLDALLKEISAVGRKLAYLGVYPESIYVGGGTPTSLSAEALDRLLGAAVNSFDMSRIKEFCVEAGRPDTITEEKLAAMKLNGVDRVSINPQTMNAVTLERIGRSHRISDVYDAFERVEASGIPHINTDLIAGLPGEDVGMFLHSLEVVTDLNPDNITVHTLAVKRASRLREQESDYNYESDADVGYMVSYARNYLKNNGYRPYYMYRQKHMIGNYENVAYAKPGTESVYNIRIMDEHQTVAALGAGGISKAYYPEENRLERVPNVSNYDIYIQRIDEMIERKEKKLYLPFYR